MFDVSFSHINTQEFSPEATRFRLNSLKGNPCYIDEPKNSLAWKEYWDLQQHYCTNGYSVGGVRITGEHYFYLNFCQIKLTAVGNNEEKVSKKKVEKQVTFPAFWDSDWFYFTECEVAREAGEHMIILKPRRRGYSYKNAAKCAYMYSFTRSSTSLIVAELSTYSEETMGMAVNYLNFLQQYTDFGKNRLVNKPKEEIESGFEENGIKLGFRSKILAFTTKTNAGILRGKDANIVLFEEAGTFGNLLATYNATKALVQEGTNVSGQMFVFGTGGDFAGGQVDFEKMFYDPETYGFRAYQNIYDEGKSNTTIGYFLPDYYSKGGFISNGISEIESAKASIEQEVERLKRSSKDRNALDAYLAEFPRTPQEAFIKMGTNIFPKAELNQQINEIRSRKELQHLGVTGIFYTDTDGKVKFELKDDLKPILNYPYKPDVDGEGCVIMYQPPFKMNGHVPDDLYYIAVDPYAIDKGKDKKLTKRDSLGSAYVFKRINNFSKPFDLIVCEYVARPERHDDFNKSLFDMAEHYNCKIVYENDRDGDIESYARINKKLHRLEVELTVYDSSDAPRKQLGRRYGVSMSNLEVKKTAVSYLKDWLLAPRDKDLNGVQELNLHKIYSIPLLEEIIKFDYQGNFDRVSAMLVAMLYKKELLLKPPVSERKTSIYEDEFFRRFDTEFGKNELNL
jgi:hypothetical protein